MPNIEYIRLYLASFLGIGFWSRRIILLGSASKRIAHVGQCRCLGGRREAQDRV